MTCELRVLEHHGLMRLVPQRRELDVRGQLTIDRRGHDLEARTVLRGRCPKKTRNDSH